MGVLSAKISAHALRNLGRGGFHRLTILAVLLTAWWQPRAFAQSSPSPIPDFTGDRIYLSGVRDDFSPLRDDIARLEKASLQTYYVVVVRSTGKGPKATRNYMEKMVDRWESQALKRGIPLDRKRSVIILVAIENHQIIVLGGEELQERFGFRDPYIERDLIQPHFIPYARSKDYLRGLQMLLSQIDRWIGERDKSLAKRREEAAAREAQLKGEAQSALETSKHLLEETRKEVEAHKAKGLEVGAYESQVRRASDDMQTATRRLSTSASEALDLAQQAERELHVVLDQLQRVAARQTEIDRTLQKSSDQAAGVLKAIEEAGRENLPVAPVQAELDAATTQIEQARQALKSDPDTAEALALPINGRLHAALEHVKELPSLRHDVEQKSRAILSLERSAKAKLDRARAAGITSDDLATEWGKASNALALARQSAGTDDRRSLASFKEAEGMLADLRDKAESRLGQYVLYTQTIPLMLFGIVFACALAVYAALWFRKRHLQGKVDAQFKGFREKAVSLMDRLDALRQRHKALPATDPDFTQPQAGATLALYQGVEKDLNALWEHWLRVMEVWDQAQKLVQSGSGLAVSKTEEAKKLMETEGNFDEILRKCGACEQALDQLNQAHEQARDALKTARDKQAEIAKALAALSEVGLPTDAYTKDLATVNGLFTQAEGLLEADPIGAAQVVAHSREALESMMERSGRVLTTFQKAQKIGSAIDDTAGRVAQLRSEGVRLREGAADPDRRLADARSKQAAALNSLRRADPAAASGLLEEANTSLERARQGMDSHLQARDAVRKELPEARAKIPEVQQVLKQTEATLDRLRRTYAEESWSDVASNLDQARSRLQAIESLLARADDEASDRTQNYLGAATALGEIPRGRAEIDRLLQAVAERNKSLGEIARQSREQVTGLEEEIQHAEAFFQENRQAIGEEARRTLDRTIAAYRELTGLLAQRLPNWPAIQRQLAMIRQGLAVALRQGREDVDGFQRVSQKLDQVKQKARTLGAMLSQEEKDRPPANQRYRAAVDALAHFENGSVNTTDWDLRLRQLGEVEGNLDRAESLARQDISLANGAIAEINQAVRTVRAARAFYERGVTVDISGAEAELSRARGALSSQSYEQAINFANAAERAANAACEAAAHEARRRRMRVESEQIFIGSDAGLLIAAAQAAAQAAGFWIGHRIGQGQSGGPVFPPAPGQAPPTGSWGSGASQGGWTSGADQAGW